MNTIKLSDILVAQDALKAVYQANQLSSSQPLPQSVRTQVAKAVGHMNAVITLATLGHQVEVTQ